jgi:CRISPR/Cas system-associated exonuclease Cas4 (RecB family)
MRTIRASEIGTYMYCKRAWWYQKRGETSENLGEMLTGSEIHYQHGEIALRLGCLRALAYGVMLVGMVVMVVYIMEKIL